MSKAEKLLAKGRALESKGKRDKALDVYRDGCRSQPYDPDLWNARGELAHKIGETKEAVEALFKVAELYMRGGMGHEALRTVKRVLELDAGHGGAKRLQRVIEEKMSPSAPETPARAQTPASVPVVQATPEPPLPEPEPPPPEPEPEPPPPEPEAAPISMPPVSEGESQDFVEVIPVEPSRPMYISQLRADTFKTGESGAGLDSRDIALDQLSLSERLPTSGHEILLEEEGKIDVVQAVASTLTSSPLLSELDSDLVRHLIDAGKLVHRGTEEIVFKQNDMGTTLWLILSGEVSVRWEGKPIGAAAPEVRELARLRPGAFFGEMALLTNTGRSATVTATKASDFLEISRKAVRELIDRDPRVLKLLMRFFRARLVGTLLQTSQIFKPFSREERRRLVSRFRLREVAADQTVITEGGKTDGLFIVLNGKLEVLQAFKASHMKVKGKDGKEGSPPPSPAGDGLSVLLGTLSPGDVFGEMSLLDQSTASATVRTRTRSWVLLLPRDEYENVVAGHPQIKDHLSAIAQERRDRNQAATALGKTEIREERLEPV